MSAPLKMVTCSTCDTKVFISGDLPPLASQPCTKCGHPIMMPLMLRQFELAEHERHHDGMAAFGAGLGGERREVTGNEHFGVAGTAGDHFQWSAHGYIIASTIPRTNFAVNRLVSR